MADKEELLQGWPDDQLVMVSALEHYVYCPRQCALIHVEQVFDENLYTMRGRMLHKRVDTPEAVLERTIRIERAVPIWSNRLGLVGRADVVEFLPDGTPFPVEYKSGVKGRKLHDDIQLCAQAICLEEMLQRPVPKGAVYYYKSRRRRDVSFTQELRRKVGETVAAVRSLIENAVLPPPLGDARCDKCSLQDACMPDALRELDNAKHKKDLFTAIDHDTEVP
jgi:CRISPR-associated exonuclease Cas4